MREGKLARRGVGTFPGSHSENRQVSLQSHGKVPHRKEAEITRKQKGVETAEPGASRVDLGRKHWSPERLGVGAAGVPDSTPWSLPT